MLRQQTFIPILVSLTLVACSRPLEDCGAPAPDYGKLLSIRRGAGFISGPRANLLLPNPIDASQNPLAQISDVRLLSLESPVMLGNLLAPSRLESAFVKMRIKGINDALSTLAQADSQGNFNFSPDTDHYSEALGYYSVSVIQDYLEALGFSLVKNRPLYVLVMADSEDGSNEVNAFYDHAKFSPDQPRSIRFYGNTQFKVSKDRDMYWHEFGHFVNESLSQERGIDFAGDSGAYYTEAAALHECLADYGAESLAGTPYIGRWIARNFPEYKAGQPLRSAVDTASSRVLFQQVSTQDPGRYSVAEWCTRVLWRIREDFVNQDPKHGEINADRLIYSAITLLDKDTSFTQFRQAVLTADQTLQCGVNQRSIETAFSDGGFDNDPERLDRPLQFTALPVLGSVVKGTRDLTFEFTLSNPSSVTARNVRVYLESSDARLNPLAYLQGFGDLLPGGLVTISSNEWALSPMGIVNGRGGKVSYRLRAVAENADDSTVDGEVQP